MTQYQIHEVRRHSTIKELAAEGAEPAVVHSTARAQSQSPRLAGCHVPAVRSIMAASSWRSDRTRRGGAARSCAARLRHRETSRPPTAARTAQCAGVRDPRDLDRDADSFRVSPTRPTSSCLSTSRKRTRGRGISKQAKGWARRSRAGGTTVHIEMLRKPRSMFSAKEPGAGACRRAPAAACGVPALGPALDSPVAHFRMMRRGLRGALPFTFRATAPSRASQEKSAEIAALLTRISCAPVW